MPATPSVAGALASHGVPNGMQGSCRAEGSFQNTGGSPHPPASGHDAVSTQRQPRRSPEPRPRPQRFPEDPVALLSAHTPCGPHTPSPHSVHSGRNARQSHALGLWGPRGSSGGLTEGPFIITGFTLKSCCDDRG